MLRVRLFRHFALRGDRAFFFATFLADFLADFFADFLASRPVAERLADLRAPRTDFAAGRLELFLAAVFRPDFELPDFFATLLFLVFAFALVLALGFAFALDFALELDFAVERAADLRGDADFFGADSVA